MRRRFNLIFTFVTFIIFFYFLLPAEARAFQVLFQDDFNDGDAAGWLEYSPWGYWKVENKEYQGSTVLQSHPESPSYSVAGDRNWTNYAVRPKADSDVLFISKFIEPLGSRGVQKLVQKYLDEAGARVHPSTTSATPLAPTTWLEGPA